MNYHLLKACFMPDTVLDALLLIFPLILRIL